MPDTKEGSVKKCPFPFLPLFLLGPHAYNKAFPRQEQESSEVPRKHSKMQKHTPGCVLPTLKQKFWLERSARGKNLQNLWSHWADSLNSATKFYFLLFNFTAKGKIIIWGVQILQLLPIQRLYFTLRPGSTSTSCRVGTGDGDSDTNSLTQESLCFYGGLWKEADRSS